MNALAVLVHVPAWHGAPGEVGPVHELREG